MKSLEKDPITLARDLAALPKAHLHLHVDGAMRSSTLSELAAAAGVTVPVIRGYGSFAQFSGTIATVQHVVTKPAHLYRLVSELVEDAAAAGAVWVEPSVWPGAFAEHLGPPQLVLELILEAGFSAARRLGIGFGLMVAANRDRGPAEASDLARLATSLRDRGVVSFGLDGDETAAPGADFVTAFAIASAAGLLATPHAGELIGAESVRMAIEKLGARRILHGVRAIEDDDLVRQLASSGICLDICPTSNVLLAVVPCIEAHPLPALLAAGVSCSVNADDPLLFGVGLLEEYELCRRIFGLGDTRLASIARTSLEASGAPRTLVLTGQAGIDAWLAAAPQP